MKLECTSAALNSAVSIVSHALAKNVNNVLENILLRTMEEGGFELIACDGSIIMRATVDAIIREHGTVLIPGKLFSELCRKLPSGTVTMTERLNTLGIVCPPSKFKLTCVNSDEFANVTEVYSLMDKPGLHIPQHQLKNMISRVSFAVSQDESRPVLTGILMEITEDELRLVALNGFCVALQIYHSTFVLPKDKQSISVIIPGRVMNELRGILSDESDAMCSFHIEGTRMLCRLGEVTIVCGLISGQYIAYRTLLPASWLTRVTVKCAEMRQAIERAQLVATMNSNNRIILKMTESALVITANSENADTEEELEALREGADVEISFNARFINDVMKNIEDECCTICLSTPMGPCVFCPTDGDSYTYLLAALRPKA